jgi:hypothetical protein
MSVIVQALLLTVVCRSLPVMPLMAVIGMYMLLSAGFRIEARRRCRVTEEGFHLQGRVISLLTSS